MMKAAGETPLAKVQWQHFASGLSRKRQARGGGKRTSEVHGLHVVEEQ